MATASSPSPAGRHARRGGRLPGEPRRHRLRRGAVRIRSGSGREGHRRAPASGHRRRRVRSWPAHGHHRRTGRPATSDSGPGPVDIGWQLDDPAPFLLAARQFALAADLKRRLPTADADRGVALLAAGRPAEAAQVLRLAVAAASDRMDPGAWLALGVAEAESGQGWRRHGGTARVRRPRARRGRGRVGHGLRGTGSAEITGRTGFMP